MAKNSKINVGTMVLLVLPKKEERLEEMEALRKKIWNAIVENYEGRKSDHDTVMYIRERMLDWTFNEDTE